MISEETIEGITIYIQIALYKALHISECNCNHNSLIARKHRIFYSIFNNITPSYKMQGKC